MTTDERLAQIVEQAAELPLAEPDEFIGRYLPCSAKYGSGIPNDVRAKLPADGAGQHDHYIYGTPAQPKEQLHG